MKRTSRFIAIAATAVGMAGATFTASAGRRTIPYSGVPRANTKSPQGGDTSPNLLTRELSQQIVAQGSTRLENPVPSENGFPAISTYGYLDDGPLMPVLDPATGKPVKSATRTEPDKNTYVVMRGLRGADPNYDYGTHFLFQGHEAPTARGYLTRINLDADAAHRVTLLASVDTQGIDIQEIDGSVWNPYLQRLMLTTERGSTGGLYTATPDYPSRVEEVSAYFGHGGYEGIQIDSAGQIWIVEDLGAPTGSATTANGGSLAKAKQPKSFIYRFRPNDRTDLSRGGVMQALRVNDVDGTPITVSGTSVAAIDADNLSPARARLHTYGLQFATEWVTIQVVPSGGINGGYDANALAIAASATPFKRPENSMFRPASGFREFFFDETGDTNLVSAANGENGNVDYGGFGGIYRLVQDDPRSDGGVLTLFYAGDRDHTAFDNMAFWTKDLLVVAEDRGDTLHGQLARMDSMFMFDVAQDDARSVPPVRLLAEGRDPSATIQSAFSSVDPVNFAQDPDNEISGLHVSNGDTTVSGLLGSQPPHALRDGWRVFWTHQHGDNTTYEIVPVDDRP